MCFFCLAVELQSTEDSPAAARTLGPADVFVSYCWVNSEKAHKSKQVRVPEVGASHEESEYHIG